MKTVYVVIRVDNVDSTVSDPVTIEAFETKEEAKTYVLADMNMFVDEAKEKGAEDENIELNIEGLSLWFSDIEEGHDYTISELELPDFENKKEEEGGEEEEEEEEEPRYIARCIMLESVQDDFENGEIPETETRWAYDRTIMFGTAEEFKSKLDLEDPSVAWDSENKLILVNYTANENGEVLSESEVEKWKNGEMKAYACTQTYKVSRRHNADNDMLAMFGEA